MTAAAAPPPLPPTPIQAGRPTAGARPECPLDASHFLLIRRAAAARKPVLRAARTARASAITTLAIAFLGLLFLALSPDLAGLLVVCAVGVIGAVEYVGYLRLRRTEPSAAVLLGRNQLAFLGVIVLYCVVQMVLFSPEEYKKAALSEETRSVLGGMPELSGIDRDIDRTIEQFAPLVTYGFYSLIIVLSIGFQGGMALYYFTRRKRIEAFLRSAPPWVLRLFAEMGA